MKKIIKSKLIIQLLLLFVASHYSKPPDCLNHEFLHQYPCQTGTCHSCLPCSGTCLTCQGSGSNCTSCAAPRFLTNNSCLLAPTYKSDLSRATSPARVLQGCNPPCNGCSAGFYYCDNCQSGAYWLEGTVLCSWASDTPFNHYLDGVTWRRCYAYCKYCTSASNGTCSEC